MGWIKRFWYSKPKIERLKTFFTKEECDYIVSDFAKNNDYLKLSGEHGVDRISSYEIDIQHFSDDVIELITNRTKERIVPITGGKIMNIWGVRYSMDTKSYMDMHYDCNEFSSVITLNNGFEGGGTYFPLSGGVYKPTAGDGYMFKANKINSYHDGHEITDGTRYVLVIRTDRRNMVLQIIDSLFLHFVDRYIDKRKDKYYKEPKECKLEY